RARVVIACDESWLETTFRRSDPAAPRPRTRHAQGCRRLHHEAAEGRAEPCGMADRDRGADHGGGGPWAIDACAHRCHEGIEPPPSSRPIASRQSRNASKTTLGVQANIMPKN